MVEVIDLVLGTTTGSLAGACHVVAGALVGAIILYISYAIVTTSAAAPAKLCSFTFSVSPDQPQLLPPGHPNRPRRGWFARPERLGSRPKSLGSLTPSRPSSFVGGRRPALSPRLQSR